MGYFNSSDILFHETRWRQVFGGTKINRHRFHCDHTSAAFSRNEGNDANPHWRIYHNTDCPGIDNPASLSNFPVIETLLSIPFSLLYNLPRLCGFLPGSDYQQQLILMSSEIKYLWFWDPSPSMIANSIAIRTQNLATGQQNDTRQVKPKSVDDPSRNDTTFDHRPTSPTFGAFTMT